MIYPRVPTYEHAGQAAGMHSHTHVAAQVRMSERVSETYQKMNFFFFYGIYNNTYSIMLCILSTLVHHVYALAKIFVDIIEYAYDVYV